MEKANWTFKDVEGENMNLKMGLNGMHKGSITNN